jgi:large subunit ribosomal protein L23
MWKLFNKKQEKSKSDKKSENAVLEEKNAKISKKQETKEVKTAKKSETKEPTASKSGNISYRVFLKPVVSEKSASMGSDNLFVFSVCASTNKVEIKKAFLETYKVMPESVRIINMPRKVKRFGKTYGTRPGWKKAMVRVPKGSKVNIFEGV